LIRVHPNGELITRFYSAFAAKDAEGMVACYTPDVTFSDPVFTDLKGERAFGMWRMLCGRAPDLEIRFSKVLADDTAGTAHWEAHYTFSQTRRKVHNIIEAEFKFRDGKIAAHRDQFDLWRWSRQALGPAGLVLGWSSLLHNAVRKKAAAGLDAFLAAR
jgi:ketosteroid isomerase-like protein